MSEPALKCENNAIFKQNYTQKLFIALKMAYYCCFGFRGNLEFPYFNQKKFHNINYRSGKRSSPTRPKTSNSRRRGWNTSSKSRRGFR